MIDSATSGEDETPSKTGEVQTTFFQKEEPDDVEVEKGLEVEQPSSGISRLKENDRKSLISVPAGLHDEIPFNSEDFPKDLYSYACVYATNTESAGNCAILRKVFPLFLSLCFSIVKVIMLSCILTDAFFGRCTDDDQCSDGMFCQPVALEEYISSGNDENVYFCNECALAFTPDAVEYCKDFNPDQCDFIFSNRSRMSLLTPFLLLLVWAMFSMLVYYVIEKSICQKALLDRRLSHMENKVQAFVVKVLSWLFFFSQVFLLPSWMTSAIGVLMASWPPETRSLIIVPFEIGLITNFDDAAHFLFMSSRQTDEIEEAAKILEYSPTDGDREPMSEFRIYSVVTRFYSYALATVAIWFTLNPEEVFRYVTFLFTMVNNHPQFRPTAPCGKVFVAGMFIPLVLTGPIAGLWALFFLVKHMRSPERNWKVACLLFLNIPLVFLCVVYSWVPIWFILTTFQMKSL